MAPRTSGPPRPGATLSPELRMMGRELHAATETIASKLVESARFTGLVRRIANIDFSNPADTLGISKLYAYSASGP
jgi:hypothetical protein